LHAVEMRVCRNDRVLPHEPEVPGSPLPVTLGLWRRRGLQATEEWNVAHQKRG
jgi:hypothetical protein